MRESNFAELRFEVYADGVFNSSFVHENDALDYQDMMQAKYPDMDWTVE